MQPMRPRFSQVVPYTRDEVIERLKARQVCQGCPCSLTILDRHVQVSISESLQHLWSPQLGLEIGEHAEGSELRGLFGPNPNVWTSFVAAYGFVILITFMASMLGLSQQLAGESPWALLSLPIGAVLLVAVYLASLVGQRLAAEQMAQLACFLREALGVGDEPPPRAKPLPCAPPTPSP